MNYIRIFLIGVVVITLGWNLALGHAAEGEKDPEQFTFIQLSDIHWGFQDSLVNPDHARILEKVVAAINELRPAPDFIVFTGDLTHATDDLQERKRRMAEFRGFLDKLHQKNVQFLPGENDIGTDGGESYKEAFGGTYYSFENKGVHFIVLDNVSDPAGLGKVQLKWLRDDLQKVDPDAKIIIFTHRPLFDLYPKWGWGTKDGAKALELLKPFKDVTVFYGHIHQENHTTIDSVVFHSAKSLMYPFPAPGSVPENVPVLWDPESPWKGLGYRGVMVKDGTPNCQLIPYLVPGAAEEPELVAKPVASTEPQADPKNVKVSKP